MNEFKGKQFEKDTILLAIGFYITYPLSYRNVSEILAERGISVHPSTIMRWVKEYGESIHNRWIAKGRALLDSWRMDETYIKIKGVWVYLYRAIDKSGRTLDMILSKHRNKAAAKRYLLQLSKRFGDPREIVTDQAGATISAIHSLKQDGRYINTDHRTHKIDNNIIEQDHRHIKRMFTRSHGFQSFETANSTLLAIETIHALRKENRATCNSDNTVFSPFNELMELFA